MKITFETPTLADAAKRAAIIAPTRGDSFDKAAGIVFDISVESQAVEPVVLMKVTDTVLYYTESLNTVASTDMTPGFTRWRVPSGLFSSFCAKLPMGSGSQVTLDVERGTYKMKLSSKRLKAEIYMIRDAFYPEWTLFDAEGLTPIPDIGQVIKQITWANTGAQDQYDGIGFGPDFIGCTDGYRIAVVEHPTGIEERFMVPSRALPQVLPQNGEVKVALDGTQFLLMPNDWTQIQTATVSRYPDVTRLIHQGSYDFVTMFNKSDVLPMIGQALDFKTGDRQGILELIVGRGELAVYVDNKEVGLFGNVADAWGDAETHARQRIKFNPDNLRSAVQAFPGEIVTMMYNGPQSSNKRVYFTNGDKYHSLVMPLKPPPKKEEDE